MQKLSVQVGQETIECIQYDLNDEPAILDIFFFWKTSVLLAERSETKKPQLPETFSEPFCCLVCDLVHKKGRGLDAYKIDNNNQATTRIEIKATITKVGFTDVKRTLPFDELFWFSFSGYASLSYVIYRISAADLQSYVNSSKTEGDRATVSLEKIVSAKNIQPFMSGRIGIVATESSGGDTDLSLTDQISELTSSV